MREWERQKNVKISKECGYLKAKEGKDRPKHKAWNQGSMEKQAMSGEITREGFEKVQVH